MLPRDVIYRSKVGFGTPLRRWIRGELSAMVTELLDPVVVTSRGILSPSGVRRLVDDNASGRADHAYAIYALLNLEIWLRTFVDQRAVLLTT